MFGAKKKKEKEEQIKSAIEKIRSLYIQYSADYGKGQSLLEGFEQRLSAIKSLDGDLTRFVDDEYHMVNEMLAIAQKQQEKKEQLELKKQASIKISENSKAMDILDEKLARYHEFHIHADASNEMNRLFGSLIDFEQKYWQIIERAMRQVYPSITSSPRIALEPRVHEFCVLGVDGCPNRLGKYVALLNRQHQPLKEIDQEEKSCLVDVAAFLVTMIKEVNSLCSSEACDQQTIMELQPIISYLAQIQSDFRLRDFGKSN